MWLLPNASERTWVQSKKLGSFVGRLRYPNKEDEAGIFVQNHFFDLSVCCLSGKEASILEPWSVSNTFPMSQTTRVSHYLVPPCKDPSITMKVLLYPRQRTSLKPKNGKFKSHLFFNMPSSNRPSQAILLNPLNAQLRLFS